MRPPRPRKPYSVQDWTAAIEHQKVIAEAHRVFNAARAREAQLIREAEHAAELAHMTRKRALLLDIAHAEADASRDAASRPQTLATVQPRALPKAAGTRTGRRIQAIRDQPKQAG